MRYNDTEAYVRCKDLKAKIDEIIMGERNSARSETSVKKAMTTIMRNYTQNEDTYIKEVQPLIVKVARKKAQGAGEVSGGKEALMTEFKDDGLHIIAKCFFVKKLLPSPDPAPEWKDMGLTEPRPDMIYGIANPDFGSQTEMHVPLPLIACLNVATGMRFPFYIEEHKSVDGTAIEAEHQAMRDGAVLVNARMKLNAELQPASYVRPVGPDLESFVFSCVWTPNLATLFCNWFEKLANGEDIFHMTKVRSSYTMDRGDDIKDLSHDLHNILDWGLLKHRWAAQEVWDSIVTKYNRG